jgi:N-acetylmuramidase/Putative peptidoglycan binding domain
MNFIGRTLALDSAGLKAAAAALKVEPASIWAVLHVETTGCGFLLDRRPVIRFERSIFHKLTGGAYDSSHPAISNPAVGNAAAEGAAQYALLNQAMALNPRAALESTSWGLGQVLGQNYALAGFADVQFFVLAMIDSENAQLGAFRSFIQSAHLAGHLQSQDWAAFARGYNGADYRHYQYDARLGAAHRLFSSGPLPDLKVRAAQLYLTLRGYQPKGVDGIVGASTIAATRAFQANAGLPQTGNLDDQTTKALVPPSQSFAA